VSGPALVERARLSMGSELRLTASVHDEASAVAAFDAVFQEFDRLESLMSVWRAGSEVLRINEAAGDRAVHVSREVLEVLAIARQVSDWTGGTFDVTFGALTGLWKFDHDQDNTIPDAQAIRRLLPLVNYKDLILDEKEQTAFLRRKGMRIHLGGIGKGYAVDRAAQLLRDRGVHDFMIQAGGDLYAGGTRGDRPWRVGIRDPRGPADSTFASLELANGTFSTSGDYERFFLKDGRRYHHILDLRTGEPARLCRSVTLVTARAVLADALAKGVFILGPREGMALIERLPGIEGVIVGARNELLVSAGLKDRLTVLALPTDAP
jgi:thiamine biosynthesis lipoprotein